MTPIIVFFGIIGATILAGFYAGIETAGYDASKIKLNILQNQGSKGATLILQLMKNKSTMLITALVGQNIAIYLGTSILEEYYSFLQIELVEFWATITLTPIFFILAEVFPKQLGTISSESFCVSGARIFSISSYMLLPITSLIAIITKAIYHILNQLNLLPEKETMRQNVAAHFAFGRNIGVIDKAQHRLVSHIMTIESRQVDEFMIPFKKIICVHKKSTYTEILDTMTANKFRYIPVVDKNMICGIISLSNIWKNNIEKNSFAENLMQKVELINSGTSLGNALVRLQQAKTKIGVVALDGKSIGLITMKILVKNIIG